MAVHSSEAPNLDDLQADRLAAFRQGDQVNLKRAPILTEAEGETLLQELELTHGAVIVTQTCDLIPRGGRGPVSVALAPVVILEGSKAKLARAGKIIRYTPLETDEPSDRFADLGFIFSIKAELLVTLERLGSLGPESASRSFARSVGRKFDRFAFPDSLRDVLRPWKDNFLDKFPREHSPEGQLFRMVEDLRISAEDDWNEDPYHAVVWLIFPPGFLPEIDHEDADPDLGMVDRVDRMSTAELAGALVGGLAGSSEGAMILTRIQDEWAQRCEDAEDCGSIRFECVAADELLFSQYQETQSLDLEFLSAD